MEIYVILIEDFCNFCGSKKLIENHKKGNIFCMICGIEKESCMIENRCEWSSLSSNVNPDKILINNILKVNNNYLINNDLFKFQKYDTKFEDIILLCNRLNISSGTIIFIALQIMKNFFFVRYKDNVC